MAGDLDTLIALEAKDLLSETWAALAKSENFGPAALTRSYNRVVGRVFGGVKPDEDEQDLLDDVVIEYVGKMLAIRLADPGIEYWSRQVIQRSIGDRESSAYVNRADDLRKLKEQWTIDVAALWLDVDPLLPDRPQRAADVPRVVMAGDTIAHLTANPYDLDPEYGPKDDTTTTAT